MLTNPPESIVPQNPAQNASCRETGGSSFERKDKLFANLGYGEVN